MPPRLARRIEYRIPVTPKTAPKKHVQMIFASAFIASATTPATNQQIVPTATKITIERMFVAMGAE